MFAVPAKGVMAVGLRNCLSGLMQRVEDLGMASGPRILAITADIGFYSRVLGAAYQWRWSADWASTMNWGLKVCGSKPIDIVVYDRDLPDVDWREGLRSLSRLAAPPRVLLAANAIDEDLWRTVLRLRGYDVLSKPANSAQLSRELRFAWLSFAPSMCRPQELGLTGANESLVKASPRPGWKKGTQ